jgi:uncharacterized protein
MTTNLAAPVSQEERIVLLDSLRGIAILGILLMNIPGFALPDPVYHDPSVLNEWGTINFRTWYFIDWFMEGSQRALFSMLFGAGIILFISRQEKRVKVYGRLIIFSAGNSGYWCLDCLTLLCCCGFGIFCFIMPASG